MAVLHWATEVGKKWIGEMKSTRGRQFATGPHDNMGTRIAIGILFILCLEQALTFEKNRKVEKEEMDQSRGKKKEKRATLDNAKILDAFSCEDGWTKMVKLPTHEDCERGGRKETESLVEWKGSFALLQKRRTKDVSLLTCSLKISIFDGHCGMWGHHSWADVPYIQEHLLMSLEECVRAQRQGKVRVGGEIHRVEQGVNTKRIVEKGSLVYDPSAQSFSCTNEPGRQTSDQSKHLKSELKMTVYEIILGRVPGRMRTDTNRIVVAGGAHEGVELTPLEVQSGGKERDGITFVIDHPEEIKQCPFALLRKEVELTQYKWSSGGFGEPADVLSGGEEVDLAGIALVGDQIAIRLESKEPLPAACLGVGGGGNNVYNTNHEGIIAVHLTPGVDLKGLDKNDVLIQEMDLDVTTASRLDLMSYHISAALKNLSMTMDQGLCMSQLKEMSDLLSSGPNFKTRVLTAGEVVVLSKCQHQLVRYEKSTNETFSSECPTYLPVKKLSDKEKGGQSQMWLEPKTRYLYQESPRKPCGLTRILPVWFELRSGKFVSFNGKEFALQQVEDYDWMEKKRYFSEAGLDVWKDVEAQGMVTGKKMLDLDIWQEYSIYLTRKAAEDQGKVSHDDSPLSRASGQSVRSWMEEMKSTTGRIVTQGVDAAMDEMGLSDFQQVMEGLWSSWTSFQRSIESMGTVGGTLYLVQKILAVLVNFFTFWCTQEGNKIDEDYKTDKRFKWCWACCGWGGKIAQACGICSLEICCGDKARKRAVMERIVKDLVEKEMLETRAHLRDVAFVDERRRESQAYELAALVKDGPSGK